MITQHKPDESFDFIPPRQSDDKKHLPDSVLSEKGGVPERSDVPGRRFFIYAKPRNLLFVYYLKKYSAFLSII